MRWEPKWTFQRSRLLRKPTVYDVPSEMIQTCSKRGHDAVPARHTLLLKNLTELYLVKSFSALHGTTRFTAVFTNVLYMSRSWASWIYSTLSSHTLNRSVLDALPLPSWFISSLGHFPKACSCIPLRFTHVGVLISLWLLLFPIFIFAAQLNDFFLDGLKKLEQRSHKCVGLRGNMQSKYIFWIP
jgi:hypothetical protein